MSKYKSILLMALLCSVQVLWAQVSVTGRVVEQKTGTPVNGATISVKNGTANAVTNADGSFTINAPQNATLVISYVGFAAQEVAASASPLNVQLVAGDNSLNEVVVVGYGTKLKRDVTSSVSRVSAREFENLPLPSFEQALQGRAAGVFINSGSGKLGQALNIRVRGISSISASQQPFVVIDGVPIVSQALGSATEPDNPLATINPDDIESIEVLKDAAASAIYGARASNGVLLVTTKSGKQGRTKVTAGAYYGWSDPTRKAEFLNATQYKELFTAAAENMGYDAAEEFEANTGTDEWNSTNNTNWADQAFQKGSIKQYTASATGGDARTRFLVSASYNDQNGILIGNRLTRSTGRVNIDHSISTRFKIGANIALSQSNNYRVPSDNAFSNPLQLNALPPLQPLKSADGLNNPNTLYYNNLIELEGNNRNLNKIYRTISSGFLEYTLAPGLRLRSQNGIDFTNFQESQYLGRRTLDGAPTGYSFDNQVTSTIFTTTNTLNYNKEVGAGNIDALVGIEYQKGLSRGASVEGRAFPSDRFTRIQNAAIISGGSSSETEFRFLSYFARANYKINEKYLIGASVRADGSSRFGADNRYGVFPAVSAGWVLSEENFLKNSNTVSFLKLRSSFGRTGNAEIGNFSALPLYTSLPYADIAGLITSQIADPALSWESTDQFDVGLDFGFLNNRITGEIDYFTKNTTDLLLNRPLPSTNGFTTITQNIGDMTNKGWEFVLNANILQGGAFRWTSSFNISTYRNEVTRLESPVTPGQRTLGRLAVGAPYGQFYGRRYAGVDAETGDALYFLADGKTTNDYSLAADTVLGNPNPDFYGGWNNRFSYKGFDLDVQTQFVSGNDVYNVAGFFQSVNGDYYDNQTVDQMAYWKAPGDVTSIPQPRLYEGNGAGKSSRWVQDGSYFRVKSVNLGYNIPRTVLSGAKIESARVYVAAQNLFTFTKYTGYDPEVNTTYVGNLNLGHDFYTPPQARTISVGVNIGL
jgi:TonB-dependent starch-binding outer membrane protein SusC